MSENQPVGRINNRPSRYRKPVEPPLLFEPLKAYRHWRVVNGRLVTPIHGRRIWENGDNEAWCERLDVKASECMQVGCGCGFYCVWNPSAEYASKDIDAFEGYITGVVEIYGKVVIGSQGARASNMRVAALYLPDKEVAWTPFRRGGNTLMKRYPDVRFYRNKKNMILKETVSAPHHLLQNYDYTSY